MYNIDVITNFKDKETEKVFHEIFSTKLPHDIQKVALRKLIMINNANSLNDLLIPPGNRLEALKGNYLGKYSIRINEQWGIIFIPDTDGKNYSDVEIVDYH